MQLFLKFSGVHVRDLRQEVPDRQDVGGPPPGCSPQPETVFLQAVRLQSRPEGFAHRTQPLGPRRQQAVRLRVLRLQNNLSEHAQRSQENGNFGLLKFFMFGWPVFNHFKFIWLRSRENEVFVEHQISCRCRHSESDKMYLVYFSLFENVCKAQ